jgi:hypothetical protein
VKIVLAPKFLKLGKRHQRKLFGVALFAKEPASAKDVALEEKRGGLVNCKIYK